VLDARNPTSSPQPADRDGRPRRTGPMATVRGLFHVEGAAG